MKCLQSHIRENEIIERAPYDTIKHFNKSANQRNIATAENKINLFDKSSNYIIRFTVEIETVLEDLHDNIDKLTIL